MLTNDRRYTPNKIIDFMFEIFKRLKNTINNKQFKFMLRNNSFNKPGLSTEHNDTDGDEILVSKTFSHHPSCINF
jgi:hypothetical protein